MSSFGKGRAKRMQTGLPDSQAHFSRKSNDAQKRPTSRSAFGDASPTERRARINQVLDAPMSGLGSLAAVLRPLKPREIGRMANVFGLFAADHGGEARLEPKLVVAEGGNAQAKPSSNTVVPADPAARHPVTTPPARAPLSKNIALASELTEHVNRLDDVGVVRASSRRPPWLFLCLVVFPALITAIYLSVFAPYRYTSEATYVVRKGLSTAGLGLSVSGITASNESSEAILVYFKSRDAAEHLAKADDLKNKLMKPSGDVFSDFPGIFYSDNKEGLYDAMRDAVDVSIDSDTGISTLSVTAFSPQDAQQLATSLLSEAEKLINSMNKRATDDAIAFTKAVLATSEDRVRDVQKRMTDFRNSQQLLDPQAQSDTELGLITTLTSQATTIDTEIAQLSSSAPKNPRLASLREQRRALQKQIKAIRERLVGSDNSLAPKISAYESLDLERTLAIQALTSAYASMEEARQEAFSNRFYLQTITAPNLPDRPSGPRPVFWAFIVGLVGIALYKVVGVLMKDAMEHVV
ncbi:hypothetical protein [Jiella flava]|uniref:Capsular polysaccharide transport system permease protein n=1 Tax=Jiella flava TaxID=2816857 RepID=A0A939FV29_9HYPH|nr:hypothetical protein [Jiella flava]MBO0661336.1 hypothetical protein [Jiella flava]